MCVCVLNFYSLQRVGSAQADVERFTRPTERQGFTDDHFLVGVHDVCDQMQQLLLL